VESIYANGPLKKLGQRLIDLIDYSIAAVDFGSADPRQDMIVCRLVRLAVDHLPESFGQRFLIDSAILSGISDQWSQQSAQLGFNAAAKYQSSWGHVTVPIHGIDDRLISLDVVLFPGSDSIDSIYLPEYAWLMHELGHNLHFRFESFIPEFGIAVSEVIRRMKRRSIADRGIAEQRSSAVQRRFTDLWLPRRDHRCWSCEVAVDLVALWASGPAFINAYVSALTEQNFDPDVMTAEHPPYRLRTIALVDAATRLGWHKEAEPLKNLLSNWASGEFERNEFDTLQFADPELVGKCVTVSLEFCRRIGLPMTTRLSLDNLRHLVDRPDECEFGIEVILAAYLAQLELDKSQFESWHKATITELAGAVTQ
jgi:hypothetical protein